MDIKELELQTKDLFSPKVQRELIDLMMKYQHSALGGEPFTEEDGFLYGFYITGNPNVYMTPEGI